VPRRSAADALRTREAIVARAVDVASAEGLEGVTLGRLAADLQMSKAGVIGHFGTKEALQLAAVEAARAAFVEQVRPAVRGAAPGLERLLALVDAWIAHIARTAYPGGCFWAAAAAEFDGRPGPVRDAVLDHSSEWSHALRRELRAAVEAGELATDTDVEQVVFELRAIGLVLNQEIQLHRNAEAEERARRAVRRAIGVPEVTGGASRASRGSASI
jgi:AcrR family transcriptional regulator